MHAFYIGGESYGCAGPAIPDMRDERKVRLGDLVKKGGRLMYEYDFGDGWTHEIHVEKVLPAETGARLTRCLAGERACPPDDCGGPPGYQNMLDILADPEDPEYEEMLEWVGEDFDPEAFDLDAVDKALRKLGIKKGK